MKLNIPTIPPITDEKSFKPLMALAFYQNGSASEIRVTKHDILNNALGLATPLSNETAISLIGQLISQNGMPNEYSLTPENLIYATSSSVIWWTKHHTRRIVYGNKDFTVHFPNLLFIYSGSNKLKIFALSNDKRPSMDSKLCHAPLFNVYGSANVCLGSVNLPAEASPRVMPTVVDEFFSARATHENHDKAINEKLRNGKSRDYLGKFFASKKGERIYSRELTKFMQCNKQLTLGDVVKELGGM